MPKVVLILPSSTYRAAAFLEAASHLDVEVVTASEQPQAMASVMKDHFLLVPLPDQQATAKAIVDFANSTSVQAVIAVDDGGVVAAAIAGEALGLVHNRPSAVSATQNKAAMRRLLHHAGVEQPKFVVIERDPEDDLTELAHVMIRACQAIGFPVVIKATTLSGSRGIIRADTKEHAAAAVERVIAIAERAGESTSPLLVEEFVQGDEIALEGLLWNDELEVLAIFDKPDPLDGPFFEETTYVTPSRHDHETQGRIKEAVQSACRAIGLTEGPIHAEARIRRADRSVIMIECAARTIGGRCATVLRFADDESLEQIVLRHGLGITHKAASTRERSAAGVMMLPIPFSGRLVEVSGKEKALEIQGITGLDITIPIGRAVTGLPEGDRYLGFLYAKRETPAQVEDSLRRAYALLDFRIEQGHVAKMGA